MSYLPPPAPPSGTPAGDFSTRFRALHQLRRARQGRAVAGVAEGLSQHFDIDPIIVRVVFAALTFFGGAGLVLYLILWLSIPMEDAPESILSGGLRRDRDSWATIGLVGGGVIAASLLLGSVGWWLPHPFRVFVIAVIAVLAAVLFLRRSSDQRAATATYPGRPGQPGQPWPPPPSPSPPAAPSTQYPAPSAAQPSAEAPTQTIPPVGDEDATSILAQPDPRAGAPAVPVGAAARPVNEPAWWQRVDPPGGQRGLAAQPSGPAPKRPNAHLLLLSFATMAIALAVVWALDAGTSLDVDPSYYPGTVLAVSAVGLLVSAFWGRAHTLIAVGLVAGLATAGAAFAGPGPYGAKELIPVRAAGVPASFHWGTGDLTLHLEQVQDPAALAGRSVSLDQHIGRLTVIVPTSLAVTIDATVDHGAINGPRNVLDRDNGGKSVVMAPPADGRPTMVVTLHLDYGQIRVLRVDCPSTLASPVGQSTWFYEGAPRVAPACH